MKGLLIKDFYSIVSQLKLFLIIIIAFARSIIIAFARGIRIIFSKSIRIIFIRSVLL